MKMCVQQKTVFFPVGILVSSSEQHLRVPLFLCTRIMISKGIVSKGRYSNFGPVKGHQYSISRKIPLHRCVLENDL